MAKQSKLELMLRFLLDKSGVSQAKAEIDFLKDKITSIKDAVQTGFGSVKKGVEVFFAPLKAVAVPAIGAVTAALGLAGKALKEFAGQQLGEADVISALKAMGQYTEQYKDKIIDLASAYQNSTGIADDFWLSAFGQLSRFGMNAGNVDQVAEALKNLTGLMGGNIDTATDALSKALQGQFDTFSRFGIVVKQSGDKLKDFDNLVKELNSKGAGLLEARAQTLSGKWQALKNQANEVFEAIGTKLASSLNVGGAVDTIKSKLATVTTSVQNGGLGALLEKAGESLRQKIEDGYHWAENIAKAIQESGKPLDQVFADAMTGAASAFMTTLKALLEASMAIWKAAGIAIFSAFKEEFLKLPGMGPIRDVAASRAYDQMSPAERAAFASENGLLVEGPDGRGNNLVSYGAVSNERRAEIGAKLASSGSEAAIAAALKEGFTKLQEVGAQLKTDLKTVVEDAAGIKKPENGKNGSASTITIYGSDGQEITMALDEYIQQLKTQNDKQAEAANAGTEALRAAEKTTEAIKATVDSIKTTTDTNANSHQQIKAALDASTSVARQTVAFANQTQQQLGFLVGVVAQNTAAQAQLQREISRIDAVVRSMKI